MSSRRPSNERSPEHDGFHYRLKGTAYTPLPKSRFEKQPEGKKKRPYSYRRTAVAALVCGTALAGMVMMSNDRDKVTTQLKETFHKTVDHIRNADSTAIEAARDLGTFAETMKKRIFSREERQASEARAKKVMDDFRRSYP